MILRLTVDNRQGVLDQITGIIRRNGWNISSINAGEISQGYSNINIRLEDRGADVRKLGKALSKLDCVQCWEDCSTERHFLRELLILKVLEQDCPSELLTVSRMVESSDGILFIEYTGLPQEIDKLLEILQGRVISCARTGALSIIKKGSDDNCGQSSL